MSGETIAERMARTPQPSGFDYLRLALSMAVVCWHAVGIIGSPLEIWTTYWRSVGGAILPMFFALSGFLVAGSLARCSSLPAFFSLRALRIVPALFAEVLVSALLIGPLFTTVPLAEYFASAELRAYFLNILGIVHFTLPGVFSAHPVPTVNTSLWTLPYELYCYLALAASAVSGLLCRRVVLLFGLVAACITSTAMILLWGGVDPTIGPSGLVLVGAFLAGLLLHLYRDVVPLSAPLAILAAVIALTFGCSASLTLVTLFPLAYLTVYLGTLNPPRRSFLLRGDYSYGLYLFGWPVQQVHIALVGASATWAGNVAFGITGGLIAAVASWHLIEKPALSRKRAIVSTVEGMMRGGRATTQRSV